MAGGKRPGDLLSFRHLASTGIPCQTKVSTIIEGDQWKILAENQIFKTIWSWIPFYSPNPHKEDQVVWEPKANNSFSIASAWEHIKGHSPTYDFHSIIWQKEHIPRHAFVLWLASKRRLKTMDRLPTAMTPPNPNRVLCNIDLESHEHLFFMCRYTRNVWDEVNGRTGVSMAFSSMGPGYSLGNILLQPQEELQQQYSSLASSSVGLPRLAGGKHERVQA